VRSTQSASQGLVIASFDGNLPYLCCLNLFTWQLWHFWRMIGLSFIDLCNTSRYKEFLRDAWSQGVVVVVVPSYRMMCRLFGITNLLPMQSTEMSSTSWAE
jgi:hypothetical protein